MIPGAWREFIIYATLQDPAVTAFRSQRGRELDPDKDKAAQYHDNALRKFVSGRKIGILPDPGSHHKHADHGSSH